MEQTAEEFLEGYELLLPGKHVSASAFAMPMLEADVPRQNEAVLETARRHPGRDRCR